MHAIGANPKPVSVIEDDGGVEVAGTSWRIIALCGAESPRRRTNDSTLVTCKLCIARLAARTEREIKKAERQKGQDALRKLLLMPKGSGRLLRPKGHGRR